MPEFVEITIRNIEQDCAEMSDTLIRGGWTPVDDEVNKVTFSNVPLLNKSFAIDNDAATVFRPGEKADRWLQTSLAKGEKTYIAMPYILLANTSLRFGLTQVAGGTIVGIQSYQK